jgi:hypothetical protein
MSEPSDAGAATEDAVAQLLERVLADAGRFRELPLDGVEPAVDFSAAWGPDD